MHAVEEGSFDLTRSLPPEEHVLDLNQFLELVGDEDAVEAMIHVAGCPSGGCRPFVGRLEALLEMNTHYAFVILGALAECRRRLGWIRDMATFRP